MIQILDDASALANAAAKLFADEARKAVALRGRFLVLLAGGETPRHTYELLGRQPYRSSVPWSAVHFFWGDDRCVPLRDARSNFTMARHAILDHLPIQREQLHPIYCIGATPQKAAAEYELGLKGFFAGAQPVFDLALLGLGEDGHTASLLPGSSSLQEAKRWTAVSKRPEEKFSRVTLTVPVLNQARRIVFLVSGENKASVLQHILQDTGSPTPYPAQLIRPKNGQVDWLVDRAASRFLT
ncbi:MAG: 6-phosphogluconolactonase [Oxalobacter sp.]|nr:MAG: 6-phosphogluconolactonase [Oxalobacter sp.]